MSDDDIRYYQTFGLYIERNRDVFGPMSIFMTIFFDCNELLLSGLAFGLYYTQ
jgi:hypothetical protein